VASADAAMYRAKEQGRNSYEIFSPMLRTQAQDRLLLEAGLRRAMDGGELVLHYQPVIDLRSMRIVGAEALVRWEHPENGLLFPGHFIPVAEQSGLVVALGEMVLHAACEQNRAWQLDGLPPMRVAVNVSARQFRMGIVDTAAAALRNTGLDPRWLELELTESAAIENFDTTIAALAELRAIGVGCALDDFGTGYCGLKYLSQLPISALKIDKSFVQAMSVRDASIVTAIISLGHGLGLRVIAEGVETAKQLDCLVAQGCDDVQGFLFSKAVPAAEFARLIEAQGRNMARDATNLAPLGPGADRPPREPAVRFESWSASDVGLLTPPARNGDRRQLSAAVPRESQDRGW
jgi:EAL domain-containing protein (putative c-di-GMP-specific phosphodiesterase class I)